MSAIENPPTSQTADKSAVGSVAVVHSLMARIDNALNAIIVFILANVILIICIVMGSVYINDCPGSPGIPIVLIVNGAINILVYVIGIVLQRNRNNETVVNRFKYNLYLLQLAAFITFIVWIVLVWRLEPEYNDKNGANYCDRIIYLFAYWLLVVSFIITFLSCCCGMGIKSQVEENELDTI